MPRRDRVPGVPRAGAPGSDVLAVLLAAASAVDSAYRFSGAPGPGAASSCWP